MVFSRLFYQYFLNKFLALKRDSYISNCNSKCFSVMLMCIGQITFITE